MQKTILITGATDGIGLETAKILVAQGHKVLLHGRNSDKLEQVTQHLATKGTVASFLADLSDMTEVAELATSVSEAVSSLDVLINNAGVLKAPNPITSAGLDVRFAVNTFAPFDLTENLWPLFTNSSRIINLSSAAQAPVDLEALRGNRHLPDMSAYAQSKLAITMWSQHLALKSPQGPIVVAINPGSLLGSKMVREGFGIAGKDIKIGADILVRAALSDEFSNASGKYFDNDLGAFAGPHLDARDDHKVAAVVEAIKSILVDQVGDFPNLTS